MTTRLFGSRLSPFVEKVVRGLRLKGLGFELIEPGSPADFRRWNPQTGKMPVLELDGERFWDSTLILRHLDERFPDPPLVSSDPGTARRQRFIEDWSDESLYWYVMALRWTAVNADATATQVAATLPVPGILRPVLKVVIARQISAQPKAQGLVRLPLDVLLDELGRRFDELEEWLGDSLFLFAERPGVADLAVFGQVQTLRSGPTPQGAELVDRRPRMAAWMARIDAATVD